MSSELHLKVFEEITIIKKVHELKKKKSSRKSATDEGKFSCRMSVRQQRCMMGYEWPLCFAWVCVFAATVTIFDCANFEVLDQINKL